VGKMGLDVLHRSYHRMEKILLADGMVHIFHTGFQEMLQRTAIEQVTFFQPARLVLSKIP